MDAISFVLGVRAVQLRGSQLKDLMHHGPGSAGEDGVKAKKAGYGFVFAKCVFTNAVP